MGFEEFSVLKIILALVFSRRVLHPELFCLPCVRCSVLLFAADSGAKRSLRLRGFRLRRFSTKTSTAEAFFGQKGHLNPRDPLYRPPRCSSFLASPIPAGKPPMPGRRENHPVRQQRVCDGQAAAWYRRKSYSIIAAY